jgi:hypothetical protein
MALRHGLGQLLADNEKELAALPEVERLFAQAAPAAKTNAPKKGDKPKKEVVQILQGARSQNVEITLSRFGMQPPELKDRLMRCDISGMDESKGASATTPPSVLSGSNSAITLCSCSRAAASAHAGGRRSEGFEGVFGRQWQSRSPWKRGKVSHHTRSRPLP